MKHKTALYFQLEIEDDEKALLVAREALNRVGQLGRAGTHVQYLEVRALPSASGNKEVWIKVDSEKATYTASATSFAWEYAFGKVFDKIRERILYEEAETAHSRDFVIAELSVPLS